VIEDNLIAQTCYQSELSEYADVKGHFFTHGKPALDFCCQHPATFMHLVILDIGLPDMDGLTLAQAIREQGIGCPMIAVSANQFSLDKQKHYQTIIDKFYLKPVNCDTLDAWLQ
jgi:CheY-like chemotaxis protein